MSISTKRPNNQSPRVVSLLTTIGLTLLAFRCANDANFNSETKLKKDETPGQDARPDPLPSRESTNNPAAPIIAADSTEVASPEIPKIGVAFDISASSEVPPTKIPVYKVNKAEFPVSKKIEGQLTVNALEKFLTASVTLAQSFTKEKDVFTQTERPVITDQRTQGNPGMAKEETFSQSSQGIVDIQVVVDNSGSMSQEQAKMSTKLQDLLKFIGNSNWQINVATTDPAKPCSASQGIIKRGESDAGTRFASAVTVGTGGDSTEQGIRQAVAGLSCATAPNWVRPNSKIVVLIASDEDNCSNGQGCGAQPYASETYLTSYLSNTLGRPLGTGAKVYGIVGIPTGGNGKACSAVYNLANIYLRAISATGGYAGEICDADYSQTFQKISQDIATLLDTKYPLQAKPDAMSLKVYVNSLEIPRIAASGAVNWEIDPLTNQTLVFKTYIPQYGDTIKVTYTVGATAPVLKSFALSQIPYTDPNGIFSVYVNGTLVQKNFDYQYSAATNSVVFNTEPPIDAEIKIVYKKAINLSTEFRVSQAVAAGKPISVVVNGVVANGYTFDQASGKIIFATPPAESASVEVSYEVLRGPITKYPLVLSGTQTKNFSIYYEKTSQVLAGARVEGSDLIVSEQGFMPGEKVIVKYFNETSGVLTVKLPQKPLTDSLKIVTSDGTCSASAPSPTLEVVLTCSALGAKTIALNWTYQSEIQMSFTMDKVLRPDVGSWVVMIDGVKTTEYTRDGQTITLKNPPAVNSIVTLEYTEEI